MKNKRNTIFTCTNTQKFAYSKKVENKIVAVARIKLPEIILKFWVLHIFKKLKLSYFSVSYFKIIVLKLLDLLKIFIGFILI